MENSIQYWVLRISEEHKHWHYDRLPLNFIHAHMENVKSQAWWWGKRSVLPSALVKVKGILAGTREIPLKFKCRTQIMSHPLNNALQRQIDPPKWRVTHFRNPHVNLDGRRFAVARFLTPFASVKSRLQIAAPCWRSMMHIIINS